MAFIVARADTVTEDLSEGVRRRIVLGRGALPDDRLRVEVLDLADGAAHEVTTDARGLAWVEVVSGAIDVIGDVRDRGWVVMIARGRSLPLVARGATQVLVCVAPLAADYDPQLAEGARADVEWSREPVLSSEHDTRQRIYLASPSLWGTDAVKGEMIIYPPGSSGAAHHHEGAEHFQYMLSGTLIADLAGEEHELSAGDLLYNLEHEVHAFRNDSSAEAVFVEFFVPGENTTVWVPGVNACAWNPTGMDIEGREPVREIPSHVHGAIEV
jgi:quercetin dioxygenase-like cupin family protein